MTGALSGKWKVKAHSWKSVAPTKELLHCRED